MKLTYLGQEGFLIENKNTKTLTDPYLSDYVDRNSQVKNFEWIRAYDPPMTVQELPDTDLVLLSHDHDDHTDPDTIRELTRLEKCGKYVITKSRAEFLSSLGVKPDDIIGVSCFEKYALDGAEIIPIPAAHEEKHMSNGYGENVFDELCFVINFDDIAIFHAGDTLYYEGMESEILKAANGRRLVMLLPVNGGDEARRSVGIVGNMNVKEAIYLARLCGALTVIPMHHDLYPKNGISNEEILAIAVKEGADNIRILAPGEEYEI